LYINYALRENKDFTGAHLLEVRNGILQRGAQVLAQDINIRWEYGDRIVILGANGVGKSTFVQAIRQVSEEVCFTGEVSRSQIARIEYLNQHYALVNPQKNLIENVKFYNPEASLNSIRNRLRDFLFFEDEVVYAAAGNLSGGEVSRLAFAMISLEPLEGLILDEPTNNLDIDGIDGVIAALENFPGGVLVVSHNVDFLRRFNPSHTYVIRNQKLEQLHLNYYSDDIWQVLTNSIQ
jgi:ATPase subunit of ABC transporter with duplicated ATPase domains